MDCTEELDSSQILIETEECLVLEIDEERIPHHCPPLTDQPKPHSVAIVSLKLEKGETRVQLECCHVHSRKYDLNLPHGPESQRLSTISNCLHNKKSLPIWNSSVFGTIFGGRLCSFSQVTTLLGLHSHGKYRCYLHNVENALYFLKADLSVPIVPK